MSLTSWTAKAREISSCSAVHDMIRLQPDGFADEIAAVMGRKLRRHSRSRKEAILREKRSRQTNCTAKMESDSLGPALRPQGLADALTAILQQSHSVTAVEHVVTDTNRRKLRGMSHPAHLSNGLVLSILFDGRMSSTSICRIAGASPSCCDSVLGLPSGYLNLLYSRDSPPIHIAICTAMNTQKAEDDLFS